jgi:hypothetical protein
MDIQADYRVCFSTASGRKVLEDLIVRSGLLNPTQQTVECANFVKEILNRCGLFEHIAQEGGIQAHESVGALVNKLFELPYRKEDQNG